MSSEKTELTRASAPITELQKITENQQKRTADTVLKEALALSNDKCNSLIEEQTRLIADLKEQELKFTSDLKSETEEKTEKCAAALGERVREITLAYRQVMEKETDELRTAVAALTKALEEEPVTKTEAAENLRKSIENTARELTEYFRAELDGSVSFLNASLKKAGEDMEELARGKKSGRRSARMERFAAPVLLLLTLCVSLVGLFL